MTKKVIGGLGIKVLSNIDNIQLYVQNTNNANNLAKERARLLVILADCVPTFSSW